MAFSFSMLPVAAKQVVKRKFSDFSFYTHLFLMTGAIGLFLTGVFVFFCIVTNLFTVAMGAGSGVRLEVIVKILASFDRALVFVVLMGVALFTLFLILLLLRLFEVFSELLIGGLATNFNYKLWCDHCEYEANTEIKRKEITNRIVKVLFYSSSIFAVMLFAFMNSHLFSNGNTAEIRGLIYNGNLHEYVVTMIYIFPVIVTISITTISAYDFLTKYILFRKSKTKKTDRYFLFGDVRMKENSYYIFLSAVMIPFFFFWGLNLISYVLSSLFEILHNNMFQIYVIEILQENPSILGALDIRYSILHNTLMAFSNKELAFSFNIEPGDAQLVLDTMIRTGMFIIPIVGYLQHYGTIVNGL